MSWWRRLWYGPEVIEEVEPEYVPDPRAAKAKSTAVKEFQQAKNAGRRARGAEPIKFKK